MEEGEQGSEAVEAVEVGRPKGEGAVLEGATGVEKVDTGGDVEGEDEDSRGWESRTRRKWLSTEEKTNEKYCMLFCKAAGYRK